MSIEETLTRWRGKAKELGWPANLNLLDLIGEMEVAHQSTVDRIHQLEFLFKSQKAKLEEYSVKIIALERELNRSEVELKYAESSKQALAKYIQEVEEELGKRSTLGLTAHLRSVLECLIAYAEDPLEYSSCYLDQEVEA